MAAHLPLCRVPERVFNMTIKCLSFSFYCGLLSLSCEPPSLLASAHFCLFAAFHPYGAASVQIKLRLFLLKLRCIFLLLSQDAPLCFMTRTLSILCCRQIFSALLFTSPLLFELTQTVSAFRSPILPTSVSFSQVREEDGRSNLEVRVMKTSLRTAQFAPHLPSPRGTEKKTKKNPASPFQ